MGNLQPLFKAEFPECWGSHTECSSALLSSIHYTQVILSTLVRSALAGAQGFHNTDKVLEHEWKEVRLVD